MTDLVDGLLTLARADAGVERVELLKVNIDRVIATALDRVAPLASAKQLALTAASRPADVSVYGDAALLERVLLILLDNAIKYTPAGGSVTVRTFRADHAVLVSVSDNGIGIAAADQSDIFERFYRSDKVRSRGVGGSGLGLSIARWIANRHGGTIEVTSALGVGSEFRLRLPVLE